MFLHVNNFEDFESNKRNIRERLEKLHYFGWGGWNCFLDEFRRCPGCLLILPCFSTVLLPLGLNYLAYICFTGCSNCCYRLGTRTNKILQAYARYEGYSSLSVLKAQNAKTIDRLKYELSSALEVRKQVINGSGNMIELLQLELEKVDSKFKREDIQEPGYS